MPDDLPSTEDVQGLARLWWLPICLGALSIIAGAIVLAKPDHSLRALAVLAGIFVLIDGVTQLVAALVGDGANRGLLALLGTFDTIIGIILIRHPVAGVKAIALLVGIWLVAAGVIRLVMAFDRASGRIGAIIVGAIEAIFGIVIVSSPHIGFAALALLVGISFIANGIGVIVFGVLLRTLKDDRARRQGSAVTA